MNSPTYTLCQLRPNSVRCLSMCLNPDLFKEVSKHNLNYDVLKSMGLRYGLLSSLRHEVWGWWTPLWHGKLAFWKRATND